MNESKLGYDELLQIIKLFEASSGFNEFHLKYGDIEIDLRKQGAAPAPGDQKTPEAMATIQTLPQPLAQSKEERPAQSRAEPTSAAPRVPAAFPPGAQVIKSPMVGTFYRSQEPGAAPFVTVGQRVTPDTTVCIVEIMKLMNSIQAGFSGVITHILVNNSEPVEFGQVLMVIDPEA